mmetsp:Transcript_90910/g.294174  ORF Transcript_90910/g.294174 Transcript_90910/m.294174 type:complete len:235 (+) Transcript_90910:1988-2692(+)
MQEVVPRGSLGLVILDRHGQQQLHRLPRERHGPVDLVRLAQDALATPHDGAVGHRRLQLAELLQQGQQAHEGGRLLLASQQDVQHPCRGALRVHYAVLSRPVAPEGPEGADHEAQHHDPYQDRKTKLPDVARRLLFGAAPAAAEEAEEDAGEQHDEGHDGRQPPPGQPRHAVLLQHDRFDFLLVLGLLQYRNHDVLTPEARFEAPAAAGRVDVALEATAVAVQFHLLVRKAGHP